MPKHFNRIPKNSHPTLWNREQLVDLYIAQDLGVFEIARILRVGHSSVDRALKRAQIAYHSVKHSQQGAKEKTYDGYKYTWDKKGKRYKAVHRLMMEEALGRKLVNNEHIHHINGIRDDNRLENLRVVDAREHRILSLENFICKSCPYK